MGVSGAQAQMDRNPGYYHQLLQGERNDSLEEAIRTGDVQYPSLGWMAAQAGGGGGGGGVDIIPQIVFAPDL